MICIILLSHIKYLALRPHFPHKTSLQVWWGGGQKKKLKLTFQVVVETDGKEDNGEEDQ